MKKIILLSSALTVALFGLLSCGQSAEEKVAAEKHKMDSTAAATKQQMETKLALQDSIKQTTSNKEMMEMQLTNAKGDLAAANDKMGKIKEWQFGRTPGEREQQVKGQTMLIDELGNNIKNLETAIQTAAQKIKDFETELKKYN